nr:MAG TPA: hypothetical protein [Bacteriophage sp.]
MLCRARPCKALYNYGAYVDLCGCFSFTSL